MLHFGVAVQRRERVLGGWQGWGTQGDAAGTACGGTPTATGVGVEVDWGAGGGGRGGGGTADAPQGRRYGETGMRPGRSRHGVGVEVDWGAGGGGRGGGGTADAPQGRRYGETGMRPSLRGRLRPGRRDG